MHVLRFYPLKRSSIYMLPLAFLCSGLSVGAYAASETAADNIAETGATSSAEGPTEAHLPKITLTASKKANSTAYTTKKVAIGKTTQSLKETPQSVSVVTRQRLDDQNISSIEEAMKNVTGITVQRFDAAGNYSIFNARGYGSDTYQIDGTTLRTDANGSYLDLAVFDRIEVLRGAAGMFSGAGEPGVSFNMVRKRALADAVVKGKLSAGSWSNYRGDLDVTGALTADGALRGRLVTALQDNDTYMNGIDNRKKLLYGTLEYDLAERTTLSVGGTYQDIDTVLSRGLPTWADGTLLNIPRKTSFVQDWNTQQLKTTEFFAELEHHLANDGLIKGTVRQRVRDNDAKYSDPSVPAANGTMSSFAASAFKREDKDLSADLFLSTPFEFAGQTHNFLVGADYLKGDSDTNYAPYTVGLTGSVNIYHDNQQAFPEPVFAYGTNLSKSELENYGIYQQLRIKPVERLTLVGGGRLSWWKSTNKLTSKTYEEEANFTPYAAVLFDITPDIAVYSSYSEIFKPQNSFSFDPANPNGAGNQIDPRTGSQVEAGLKAALLDGRLNASAAIFQIEDKNRAVEDLAHKTFSLASGKVRSRGFEVDLSGQITDSLQLSSGYAFNRTKYLEDNTQKGSTFNTFTPKHNFNLWTHYKLPATLIEGLEVGAGVRAVSHFYSQSGTIRVEQGGYAVAAAQVAYQINPTYKLALNVDNLFDKKYYEKVSGTSRQNFFGSPRSITASLSFKY